MGAEPQDAGSQAAVAQDASDLRRYYLRGQMRKPLYWVGGVILVIAVGVGLDTGLGQRLGLHVGRGPVVGVIGAAVAALIAFGIVRRIAASRAEDDFFRAYANAHGLAWSGGRGSLPKVTALLRKGDSRYTERTLTGQLPAGPNAVLAHYTYDEVRPSGGSTDVPDIQYYRFTLVFCELPEVAAVCQELTLQGRSGFRILDSTEDKHRKRQRVEVESEAFDKRYETFIGEHDDMNKARQVFEPTFIVWLAEDAPKNFSFELASGALCVAVNGHLDSAKGLDAVWAGANVVAKRLLDEAEEAASVTTAKPVS